MELLSNMNIIDIVVDEIALEGLDGITLEALWDRLALRLKEKGAISEKLKEQVWDICLQMHDLCFYELETPRPKLIIFNRYDYIDPDLGIILEPEIMPEDIYPHWAIDDVKNGIKGSCETYYTRKEIGASIKSLNVHEAQRTYGQKLVIVASQDLRQNALIDNHVCPTLEMTVIQYCFLERVGRSRYHGEVTQGKLSLGALQEDPRSLFYHRKFLLRHKLITKQLHHQKSGGHSCSGSLIHLPRFFVERKPKVIYLAQKVVEILKSKENQIAEYSEIKKELGIENSIKKLFKTSCFQNVVKTDMVVPYRTLYPHADKAEWQTKNNPGKEKMLRVVQLIDNNIDVSDLWTKEEILEDEEPYEMDISEQKFNVPYLKQANVVIEASGPEGLGQSELGRRMGLPKLLSRTIFRNLAKSNIVAIFLDDMGRQRVTKYVSRKYEDGSRMSKRFKQEACRMRKLVEAPVENTNAKVEKSEVDFVEKKDLTVTTATEKVEEVNHENSTSKSIEIKNENGENGENDKVTSCEKIEVRDTRSLEAATKILNRYKMYGGKYKKTFQNIAGMKDEVMEAVERSKRPRLSQEAAAKDAKFAAKVQSSRERYKRKFQKIAGITDEADKKRKRPKLSQEAIAEDVNDAEKVSDTKIADITTDSSLKIEENLLTPTSAMPPRQDVRGLMDDLNKCGIQRKYGSNVTYRLLKRANIIIESVKEHKVVDDMTKLMKMITEEEEKEGYDVKIDKKSLIRLLQKLAKDELVKNIKLTLSTNGKKKTLTFICDPSIDVNHTVIRSAVEQAKIKFSLSDSQKVETTLQSNSEKVETSLQSNSEKMDFIENGDELIGTGKLNEIDKECRKSLPSGLVYDSKAGKHYGYSPKFIRMQTLHVFLFYLVYEHPGKPIHSKEKMLEILRSKGLSIDEITAKEIGGVYNTEIGWKMFVPPLPKHNGWPAGWALMCDILLRLPLSIFLKVHKVAYNIPELDDYRTHPIRKHLLVKDLPAPIRNLLLVRRKYIFSVHDVSTRLCFVGLLQFGPQRLKEKDKYFVFLNRKTELMDTTTSAAHYHKIEAKPYAVTKFHFSSLQMVEKYWYKLWMICINTRLGGRLVVQGKDIILEELDKKVEMIEAIKPRTPEEAEKLDNGTVPGDRMGAAGIDSAFFAHLKRNWNWNSTNFHLKKGCAQFSRVGTSFESERDAHMSKVKPKPLKFTEFHGLRKITGPVTVAATDLKKAQNNHGKSVAAGGGTAGKKIKKCSYSTGKCANSNRQRSYVRRVLPRRKQIRARVKYDEIDYSALQQMDKLRVDWATREDNILLVCKVAMMYLCPNPRRQLITFTAVRDVLRSYSLLSHNKTSRACQRRLFYIMKVPQTFHSVNLGVEELKQNYFVNRRFGDIVDKLKKEYRNPHQCDQQLTLVFRDLVAYIAKKNYDISDIQSAPISSFPNTVEEFRLFYRIRYPPKPSSVQGFHNETTNDIHAATINSVIHSSMCCGKDRRSWAYQLFRIYQQYPEWLLRSAMAKIRTDQMISVKKHYIFAMRKQTNACMPTSSSQYQLSSGYIQKFNTKLPYSVFKESYEFFIKLVGYYHDKFVAKQLAINDDYQAPGVEAVPINGGIIASIHEYINLEKCDIDIEIPQQVIMLDPELSKDDERYIRIAHRYQDMLRNIEHIQMDEIFESNKTNVQEVSQTKVIAEIAKDDIPLVEKAQEEKKDDKPHENSSEKRMEPVSKNINSKTAPLVSKSQDSETHVNTDTEACESDREVNFEEDDDDDSYDDEIEFDEEDDNLISILDGKLKIKLTSEDIERSGLKINVNYASLHDNKNISTNASVASEKNKIQSILIASELKSSDEKSGERNNEVEDVSCTEKKNDSTKEDKVESNDNSQVDEDKNATKEQPDRPLRVNALIANVNSSINTQELNLRGNDVNDAAKKCTRIAILKMREELNDLTPNDSHHAHEYFVLNKFKIFYALQEKPVDDEAHFTTIQKLKIPTELVPLKIDAYDELLDDLKKFATFPKTRVSYNRFKRGAQRNQYFNRGMDAVHEFIREKHEVGASLGQLATKFFPILGDMLFEILSLLKEGRVVLRSGVKDTRYIHEKFADPWLTHSYKISRLQKEGLPIVPSGSLYVIADEKNNESEELPTGDLVIDEDMDESGCKKNRPTCHTECENATSCQRKMQKSRTCLLPTKDVYRSAKQLNLDTAEEIRVVVRPWIRVDGAINFRVLDRMLGGVLAYALAYPGAYLTKIQEKFAPALQPFHTKELIEMLAKLECLKIGSIRKTRATLFSKPSPIKPIFSRFIDRIERSEEELFVEPVLDATLKFAEFLSNRTYTTDFLAQ